MKIIAALFKPLLCIFCIVISPLLLMGYLIVRVIKYLIKQKP
jgi:hypothetical protein